MKFAIVPTHVFALVFLLAGAAMAQPQTRNLMPVPQSVDWQQGKFRLTQDLTVGINGLPHDRLYAYTGRVVQRLSGRTGFLHWPVQIGHQHTQGSLQITVEQPGTPALYADESYTISVSENQISLRAPNDLGAMRGLETLLQLLEADEEGYYFPAVAIQDAPRFPWRGLMLDVSRHFLPIEVIYRNLDAMAAMKLNVFHWHLSDDHGWRVELRSVPELHRLASDGQYYTQEQIRSVIAYAEARGIWVMPECDVPGHGSAILTALPQLGSKDMEYDLARNAGIFDPTLDPTNEEVYVVLEKIIAEMVALFPSPYFHIGGDENEGHHWDENPNIQEFMQVNGIEDNHELQGYFNARLHKILAKYDREMMGWEEILAEGIPESTVIHSWRGANEGLPAKQSLVQAAKAGYPVVLSNGYYIDLMYPTQDHYLVDPMPEKGRLTAEEEKLILGGEATMWSELVTPLTVDSRIWPRTAAIAERFWSDASITDLDDMQRRLKVVSYQLEELGLQHLHAREVILRNLTRNGDVATLRELVEVCEPLQGYTRNPLGVYYTVHSPYTLFADACMADARLARDFNAAAKDFVATGKGAEAVISQLERWATLHERLSPTLAGNPVLLEVKEQSKALSDAARMALIAMDVISGQKALPADYVDQAEHVLNHAAEQEGGRTQLANLPGLRTLVEAAVGENLD
ncbi:MAG TPA: beta-hexosaminidase [Cytophagales bacterium]|nr:beta-hexosaminidase [Cytophagales bacterium]